MDTAQLISYLSNLEDLSENFLSALKEVLQSEIYKSHQILHAAGHKENRLYFIQSGLARNYYYDHNGSEHTVKFWQKGDILFSYEGYYEVSSYFYTEIIEDSQLITLSYHDLHVLGKHFPEIGKLIKNLLLSYQQEEYKKQELISLSARDRYLKFRAGNSSLFQKTPLKIIASYLQMTRETLTRLIAQR